MKKNAFLFILIVIPLFITLISCKNKRTIERTLFLFDTMVNIKIDGQEENLDDIENILNEVSFYTDNFDEYADISNLATLNRERRITQNDLLCDILNKSLELKDITSGYFNPFIGKVSLLYKDLIDGKRELDDVFLSEVALEITKMNSSNLVIKDGFIEIVGDADIDLGAIAKGYAIEKVKVYLKEKFITNYIINLGTSSILLGEKESSRYKIGLKYDANVKLEIKNKSLTTSSIYEQAREINGVIYHHIIDPFSGKPANLYDAIYLVGDNAMLLDALTTAFFSMELDDIKNVSVKYGIDWLVYSEKNLVSASKGDYIYG